MFSKTKGLHQFIPFSFWQSSKRTDYPGRQIASKVQKKWDGKFNKEIKYVSGDEWVAGNLSYHLNSRPTWIANNEIETKYELSVADVFEDNISEAVSKLGYFKIYGK